MCLYVMKTLWFSEMITIYSLLYFAAFCRYGKYIPRDFLRQGYQAIETSGLTNSCLFESASLVVYGYRRPNYLRLVTLITGVTGIDQYVDEVKFSLK